MVHGAGVNAKTPGEHRCPAGQAGHVRSVNVGKPHTLSRDRVNVGARIAVVAVAPEMVGSQAVDVDVENTHDRAVNYGRNADGAEAADRPGASKTVQEGWRPGCLCREKLSRRQSIVDTLQRFAL